MNKYTGIAIYLTNKQFPNDIESIIQNAINAQVSKMILTGTSVKFYPNATILFLTTSYQKQYKRH